MQTDTQLAGHLRAGEGQDTCDAVAKEILANKEILAWILQGVVEEFKNCSIRDIADKYIETDPEISTMIVDPDMVNRTRRESVTGMNTEDKTINEGTVYYDIRFSATAPVNGEEIQLIINVEAQNAYRPGYPLIKRGLYYCARMISAQNGTEFVIPHYEDIKKVYSIWICSQPPKRKQQAITRYYIAEEPLLGHSTEKKENYDLMSVIFINLSNDFNEQSGQMIDLLNTALTDELKAEEKIKVLHENYGITMTRKLEGDVSLMCNISEGYRIRGIEKGREEGLEIGRAEGRAEGRTEGILEAMVTSIKNIMEGMHFSADQAMNILKISEADKPKYLALLEEQKS